MLLRTLQRSIKSRKFKAATLVELIVSVAILSVLASLLLLNGNLISRYREKTEIKNLVTSINLIRNTAITSRSKSNIEFDFKKNTYSYMNRELVVVELKELKFSEVGSNVFKFSFTKNGAPTNDGSGTIVLEGADLKYTISVTPVIGKVNLKEVNK